MKDPVALCEGFEMQNAEDSRFVSRMYTCNIGTTPNRRIYSHKRKEIAVRVLLCSDGENVVNQNHIGTKKGRAGRRKNRCRERKYKGNCKRVELSKSIRSYNLFYEKSDTKTTLLGIKQKLTSLKNFQ